MKGKNFLLLSLEDEKAQKIAHILTNDSCKKILNFLAENQATETQISKELNIPLPTVHYNLKMLLDGQLILWDKYHYPEKGKQVKHYTIANKYIVIAPNTEKKSFFEKLKGIFPVYIIIGIFSYLIYLLDKGHDVALDTYKMTAFNYDVQTEGIMLARGVTEESVTPLFLDQILAQITHLLELKVFWFILGAFVFVFVNYIFKFIKIKILKK